MRWGIGSFLLVALLGAAPAWSARETVVRQPDKVVVQKRTVIDFQDVAIDGEIRKPVGSYTVGHSNPKFGRLIKLRTDFVPELQKSADHL